MARPSPEPPGRDELEKGVKSCARTLGGTPGPVSAISRIAVLAGEARSDHDLRRLAHGRTGAFERLDPLRIKFIKTRNNVPDRPRA